MFDSNIKKFIGCFKVLDCNNIIKGYNLYLPEVINLESMLMNIHEISHAIVIDLHIGNKDVDDPFEECIPIVMERFYIANFKRKYLKRFNEFQREKMLKYGQNINYYYKYIIALSYQFELYNLYKNNINKLFEHNFDFDYDLNNLYNEGMKKLVKKEKILK